MSNHDPLIPILIKGNFCILSICDYSTTHMKYLAHAIVEKEPRKKIIAFLFAVAVSLLVPARAASALSFFSGAMAPDTWSGPGVPSVTPQQALRDGAAGLMLPLPMQRLSERAYWDATVSIDLSRWSAFTFDIQIEHPEAVKRASIYFRSGAGWYGGWFDVKGNGWKTITLSKADFQPEGSPAGWDKIRGIRIAFWKQDAINTTAHMANFRAVNVPIRILRNTDARATKPQDADFANRLTDRLQMWFRQYDIPASVITDDELRTAPPPQGTKLIILPFNPVLTNRIPPRLKDFTDQGGKLIVAYALDDFIAPLLGLDRWEWMRAEPADAFAFMHFNNGKTHALPERVAQDSWNINRPYPSHARVLATWQNAQGTDSGIPAVTIAPTGVFLGHVLTNIGREEKMRMLMALIAILVPDLAPELAEATITHATSLLHHTDWESSRDYILQTARRHRRHRRIQPQLDSIDRDIHRLRQRIEKISYPQAATHAWAIRQRIQIAYYESFSARNAVPNEFRGVWAHHAAGIRGIPWSETVHKLKKAGINHLFANVLWAGAAFYPSDVIPSVAGTHDYAREVIAAGKKHGVNVHAWMVLWSLQHAPEEFVAKMRTANRLQREHNGDPSPWLCPSHPENRKLAKRAAVEFVQRYTVTGFHIDYIRYPDAKTCYCNGCRQRFATSRNINIFQWPEDVTEGRHRNAWQAWRREVIDTMIAELYQAIKAATPDVEVSAAVWPGWPAVRDSIAQDWPDWGRKGWVDFFAPMNYVDTAAEATRIYRAQRLAVSSNTPIYPGIAPSTLNLDPATTLQHIDALRDAGAPGFILFDLDRDLLEQLLPAMGAGATRP